MIQYQRIGDKRNSYIIYVLRPNKDGGYIHPVQTIVTAETEQGDEFRTYTNARAPLVSRRISRENNSPMLEKSPQNAKQGENNYPFRCLYCEKQDEIPHEDYITYVMGLVKNIINNSSKYKTEFVTDVRLSDATIDGDRPFDHVITDKGIQTILYRYYFMDHLDETTYDEEKKFITFPKISQKHSSKTTKTLHTTFSLLTMGLIPRWHSLSVIPKTQKSNHLA